MVVPEDKQGEITEKIKSILRLANRTNSDGEREAAEFAAKRLADKNGIALETIEVFNAQAVAMLDEENHWRYGADSTFGYITYILRKHFGVILIQTKDKKARRFRCSWVGTKVNIDIAKYVTDILYREVTANWRVLKEEKNRAKSAAAKNSENAYEIMRRRIFSRKDFYDGWFAEIDRKLTEHPLRNDVEQFTKEKMGAEDLLNKIRELNRISVVKVSSRKMVRSNTSLYQGITAARAIHLNRPCGNNERTTGKIEYTPQKRRRMK